MNKVVFVENVFIGGNSNGHVDPGGFNVFSEE